MAIPSHLLPTSMPTAHFGFARRDLLAPIGTKPEHVVDPDYWAHLAERMQVNTRIEVVAEDGSFDVDLRVVAIDPRKQWAQVRVLRGWPAAVWAPLMRDTVAPTLPATSDYMAEWGGKHRWRIVRDKDVVEHGFASKDDALARIAELIAEKRKAA